MASIRNVTAIYWFSCVYCWFMNAFTAKGRLSPLLRDIPVRVIMNPKTALLGAARHAALGLAD